MRKDWRLVSFRNFFLRNPGSARGSFRCCLKESAPKPSSASFASELKSSSLQPLFQHRKAVVAPERLIFEYEDRHAEDMVSGGFVLRAFIVRRALAREIGVILKG